MHSFSADGVVSLVLLLFSVRLVLICPNTVILSSHAFYSVVDVRFNYDYESSSFVIWLPGCLAACLRTLRICEIYRYFIHAHTVLLTIAKGTRQRKYHKIISAREWTDLHDTHEIYLRSREKKTFVSKNHDTKDMNKILLLLLYIEARGEMWSVFWSSSSNSSTNSNSSSSNLLEIWQKRLLFDCNRERFDAVVLLFVWFVRQCLFWQCFTLPQCVSLTEKTNPQTKEPRCVYVRARTSDTKRVYMWVTITIQNIKWSKRTTTTKKQHIKRITRTNNDYDYDTVDGDNNTTIQPAKWKSEWDRTKQKSIILWLHNRNSVSSCYWCVCFVWNKQTQ